MDEILAWLYGEGELVTSGEPTKKYLGSITEGIDLNRLCRFRTGKVKIHVQPYKYEVDQTAVEWTDTSQKLVEFTVSGNTKAAPVFNITGSGTVNVSIDDVFCFRLDFAEDGEMVHVDSGKLEAYGESMQTLKNRQMIGEFPFPWPGTHTVSWDGEVTALILNVGNRWL